MALAAETNYLCGAGLLHLPWMRSCIVMRHHHRAVPVARLGFVERLATQRRIVRYEPLSYLNTLSARSLQAADDAKFMPSLAEATFLPWDVHPRKAKEIMMLQRFVFAEEAQELGLVNRIVPRAQLQQQAVAVAGLLASFDSFHMEMIKLTCNQAHDAPGLSAGVRSTLSNWGIYRSAALDPGSSAVGGRVGMEGAESKRFAPVAAALQPGVPLSWTEAAGSRARPRL